jgi:hypothetical protein
VSLKRQQPKLLFLTQPKTTTTTNITLMSSDQSSSVANETLPEGFVKHDDPKKPVFRIMNQMAQKNRFKHAS